MKLTIYDADASQLPAWALPRLAEFRAFMEKTKAISSDALAVSIEQGTVTFVAPAHLKGNVSNLTADCRETGWGSWWDSEWCGETKWHPRTLQETVILNMGTTINPSVARVDALLELKNKIEGVENENHS